MEKEMILDELNSISCELADAAEILTGAHPFGEDSDEDVLYVEIASSLVILERYTQNFIELHQLGGLTTAETQDVRKHINHCRDLCKEINAYCKKKVDKCL